MYLSRNPDRLGLEGLEKLLDIFGLRLVGQVAQLHLKVAIAVVIVTLVVVAIVVVTFRFLIVVSVAAFLLSMLFNFYFSSLTDGRNHFFVSSISALTAFVG